MLRISRQAHSLCFLGSAERQHVERAKSQMQEQHEAPTMKKEKQHHN
jgi:hypothetical protein